MKAIHTEFLHALVLTDIDKREIRKVVRNKCAEKRKINLLKDVKNGKRFQEKVIKLVDVGVPNLCGHFKNAVLEACDEVCGKKRVRRRKILGGGMKR